MRAPRVLGISFVTTLALLVACSSTENHEISECSDAAVATADVDAGPTTPVHPPVTAPVLRTLQSASNVELLGITTGTTPYAIYWVVNYPVDFNDPRTWDLMAAPIWGGDPTAIVLGLDDDDPAVVNGGGVAWWTTTSSDNLQATSIGVWTPQTGPQTLNSQSFAGLFAATEDGSMVAYSASSDSTSTPMFITAPNALTSNNATIQGANVVNLISDSPTCEPQMEFASTTLVMSYCAGTDSLAMQPSLFTVMNGKVVERVPSANDLSWSVDSTGNNIFITDPSNQASAILSLSGDQTQTTNLGSLTFGQMLKNGTTIALDGTSFVTFKPDGTKTVVSPAGFLVAESPNHNLIAFSKNTTTATTLDIQIADIGVSPPTLTTIRQAPDSEVIGFTGDSQHILYVTPVTIDQDTGLMHGPLKSMPVAGGTETALGDSSYFASAALAGTGVVSTSASQTDDGELYRETFGYVDVVKGGAASNVSSVLRYTQGMWFDRTYVYEDLGVNAGLYALEVP